MLDTDTFLTAVYTVLDDLYQAHYAPLRAHTPGQRPTLSDSEVLTLLVAQHWFQLSERALLRRLRTVWAALFPTPLSQSAFNRRGRGLSGVLAALVPRLAQGLGAQDAAYQILDGTPLPLVHCCRAARTRPLHPDCAFGKGGSDRRYYYGCKLLLAVTPTGTITGFVAGPASTEERWLAEALLSGRAQPPCAVWQGLRPPHPRGNGCAYIGPQGPLWPRPGVGVPPPAALGYLGDRGFSGAWWTSHWASAYGARVVTPREYAAAERRAHQAHASLRQIVETVNDHVATLGVAYLRVRTRWGLRARVGARLVAHNVGILLNRHYGRPDLAFATLVT